MIIGHGYIPLTFGYGPFKTTILLFGGPIKNAPPSMLSVNLRKEAPDYGVLKLLIPDFGVPTVERTKIIMEEALREAMKDDRKLYTGCLGGTGRTGLFLAVAAVVAGKKQPISFVRNKYKPHAVETPEQEEFVMDFIGTAWAAELRSSLNRAGFVRYFTKHLF